MPKPSARVVAGLALIAVAAVALARAWTSDDAFITFRVVEQFLAGHGPVYNAGERVQVFTHPLWFLVLATWGAAGGSLFPGAMALSLVVFSAGLAATFLAFRDKPVALAAVALSWLLSRTFTDFATSGLETPLSFALLAGGVCLQRLGRPAAAVALLSLVPLNRLDLLPVVAPFAWIAFETRSARLRALAALAAPAMAWALFSTVYYGDPLPNTALAKLAGGPLAGVDGGAGYVVASLVTDPAACALLVAAAWAAARRAPMGAPDRRLLRASLASAALALAYVLWAGGDFMLGRFLLPALWSCSFALLAAAPRDTDPQLADGRSRAWVFAARVVGCVALAHAALARAPLLDIFPPEGRSGVVVAYAGAIDERLFYLRDLGAYARHPLHAGLSHASTASSVAINTATGVRGYSAPLDERVIDTYALTDPLLARLAPLPNARPGHAIRPTLRDFWRWSDPSFRFGDAVLDEAASRLRLAHVEGGLLAPARWRAIAWLARHRALDIGAVRIRDLGSQWQWTFHPALFDRAPQDASAYGVSLRLYDAATRRGDRGMFPTWGAYDTVIDRDCNLAPAGPANGWGGGIVVGARDTLEVTCPKSRVAEGVLLGIRAIAAHDRGDGESRLFPPVPLLRPPFTWWAGAVGSWIGDAWLDRPWRAWLAALVLCAIAAALASRSAHREAIAIQAAR